MSLDKKYLLVGMSQCPYMYEAIEKFGPTEEQISFDWEYWKKKGCETSPSIVDKITGEIVATGPDMWRNFLNQSGFGNIFSKRPWGTTRPLGSGSYRRQGESDYIPQPRWGKFSASAPGRAGNAIPQGKWLFNDYSSPNFPIQRPPPEIARPSKKMLMLMMYGSHKPKKLTKVLSSDFYNKRGKNGFNKVPKSIYMKKGGQVFNYSYSPYTGARMSGTLPRPYGPRDNAALKGYPNSPLLKRNINPDKYYKKYANHFGPFVNQGYESGFGPFVNQAYNVSKEEFLDYSPFINQPIETNFGKTANIIGYRNANPLFRQHYERNWKPGYNSYANESLYTPTWNPYQNRKNTPEQNKISKNAKAIRRKENIQTGMNFGQIPGYKYTGPNLVAYENPMLVYPGAGSNTVNYLTARNYLKPCRKHSDNKLKVRKNNNPRGFLANSKTVPVRMNFGQWANSKSPWVAHGKQVGRPFTTQMVNTNDSSGSGPVRIGQPMDLYTYMNTPYGGYRYPEFLGPRSWMGGFGSKRKSTKGTQKRKSTRKTKGTKERQSTKGTKERQSTKGTKERQSTKGTQKRQSTKGTKKRQSTRKTKERQSTKVTQKRQSTRKTQKKKIKPGDTLQIKNGKVKLLKS